MPYTRQRLPSWPRALITWIPRVLFDRTTDSCTSGRREECSACLTVVRSNFIKVLLITPQEVLFFVPDHLFEFRVHKLGHLAWGCFWFGVWSRWRNLAWGFFSLDLHNNDASDRYFCWNARQFSCTPLFQGLWSLRLYTISYFCQSFAAGNCKIRIQSDAVSSECCRRARLSSFVNNVGAGARVRCLEECRSSTTAFLWILFNTDLVL